MPGSMGEVERGLCFDAGCNLKKASAHLKAMRASTASGDKKEGQSARTQAVDAKHLQTKKASANVGVITTKIKEYRVGCWRTFAAKATYADPELAVRMLVSLGLAGYSRHIDSSKLQEAFVALAKANGFTGAQGSIRTASKAVEAVPMQVVNSLVHVMAASAFKAIDEQRLREALGVLQVRIADFWQLDAEYLGLLTKSEMEALAAEIGLKEAMGDEALRKALAQKKDQAVAALLSVEGFDYRGVVPKAMRFDVDGEVAIESGDAAGNPDDDGEAAEADADSDLVTA